MYVCMYMSMYVGRSGEGSVAGEVWAQWRGGGGGGRGTKLRRAVVTARLLLQFCSSCLQQRALLLQWWHTFTCIPLDPWEENIFWPGNHRDFEPKEDDLCPPGGSGLFYWSSTRRDVNIFSFWAFLRALWQQTIAYFDRDTGFGHSSRQWGIVW